MPLLATEKCWRLRLANPTAASRLRAANHGRLVAALMAARGYADPEKLDSFLSTDISDLEDPWQLDSMDVAVKRIVDACRLRQRIAVFGDYDVDGVTATTLLVKLFTLLGTPVEFYIPDRVNEGYGPNIEAFTRLRQRGVDLCVTVDCGVSCVAEAAHASAIGLDLIITDHHLAPPVLPAALALINPKTSPTYPYPMLGGVGVAWKLAQTVLITLEHPRTKEFLDSMLELVALGTICDVAPLDGENRILVKHGLERIRQGRWLGLRSLCAVAGIEIKDVDAGKVGFALGPRLNAGGRIGDAGLGVRMLLSKDSAETLELAQKLDGENRRRQELEKNAVEQAIILAEERVALGDIGLVLWSPEWHPGIVGLVASRLLDRLGRPVLVLSIANGVAKGSGRSRRPFHLLNALELLRSQLSRFGGHEVAAGLTLPEHALESFRHDFDALAKTQLKTEDLIPVLDADLEVRLSEMDEAAMLQLESLEPFGMGNARPVFLAKVCQILPGARRVGVNGDHLRLKLRQGSTMFQAIAFRQGPILERLQGVVEIDILFQLDRNDFQGQSSLQLNIKDIRPSGIGDLISREA